MARTPRKKAAAAGSRPPAAPAGLGVAERGGVGKIFTSSPVKVDFAGPGHRVHRVDLEIDGIYHGEASYEGRIFFNNDKATGDTPRSRDEGYAGSFYVFAHGGCLGDPGHCDVNDRDREPYDLRRGHPLKPMKVRVNVTKTLQAIAAAKPEVVITIVPVIAAANELCDKENVLRFEGMRFVGYDP
jgi:hypothetical protein